MLPSRWRPGTAVPGPGCIETFPSPVIATVTITQAQMGQKRLPSLGAAAPKHMPSTCNRGVRGPCNLLKATDSPLAGGAQIWSGQT